MAYYRETIHPIKFVERTIIMVRVACCWDDGMETDLRLIELLKKYHAKATFNLNPGLYYPDRRRTSGWQFPDNPHFINRTFSRKELPEVYRGFRIASHGYFHADLRKVTTEEYVYDATEARKALEDLFQMEIPGFVYGGGFCSEEAARALADAGFVYGRTVENTDHVLQISNPLLLKSSAHFRHGDFLDRFEAAKRENGVCRTGKRNGRRLNSVLHRLPTIRKPAGSTLWTLFARRDRFHPEDRRKPGNLSRVFSLPGTRKNRKSLKTTLPPLDFFRGICYN